MELYVNEQQWLDSLKPALAAQNPPSPSGMLNLRSARTAVDARLLEAQADRLAAEFELAIADGLSIDKSPAIPTSIPFAGHFPVTHAAGQSWTVRQIEAELSGRERTVNDYAAAVPEADAARAAATGDFLVGRTSLEHALAAIDVKEIETATFSNALSDYNQIIAKYVAAWPPPHTKNPPQLARHETKTAPDSPTTPPPTPQKTPPHTHKPPNKPTPPPPKPNPPHPTPPTPPPSNKPNPSPNKTKPKTQPPPPPPPPPNQTHPLNHQFQTNKPNKPTPLPNHKSNPPPTHHTKSKHNNS